MSHHKFVDFRGARLTSFSLGRRVRYYQRLCNCLTLQSWILSGEKLVLLLQEKHGDPLLLKIWMLCLPSCIDTVVFLAYPLSHCIGQDSCVQCTNSTLSAHLLEFLQSRSLLCRYLDGLADAVSRAGGQVFEQTRVQRSNSRNCTTQDGVKVSPHCQQRFIKIPALCDTAAHLVNVC